MQSWSGTVRIMNALAVLGAFILCALCGSATPARAQEERQDVVYLKNGSIIRGEIVEQVPNQSLKIETPDGSIFFVEFDDVEKITRERVRMREDAARRPARPRGTAQSRHEDAEEAEEIEVLEDVEAPDRKSPGGALTLSLLIAPGVGQWYNGEVGKGFLHFGLKLAATAMVVGGFAAIEGSSYSSCYYDDYYGESCDYYTNQEQEALGTGLVVVGAVGSVVLTIASSVDAYKSAWRINERNGVAIRPRRLPTLTVAAFTPDGKRLLPGLAARGTF